MSVAKSPIENAAAKVLWRLRRHSWTTFLRQTAPKITTLTNNHRPLNMRRKKDRNSKTSRRDGPAASRRLNKLTKDSATWGSRRRVKMTRQKIIPKKKKAINIKKIKMTRKNVPTSSNCSTSCPICTDLRTRRRHWWKKGEWRVPYLNHMYTRTLRI